MKVLKYLGSQCTIPLFGLFWDFISVYDQFEFWVKPLWSGPIIACLPFFRKRAKKGQQNDKKGKKRQNIWKCGQKCIKFENILNIFDKVLE